METPAPPPRCLPCGKRIHETQAEALQEAMRLRLDSGLYRDEYRCPGDPLGGWHLRDLKKRYAKVRGHNGVEAAELLRKIKRLDDVVPTHDHRAKQGKSGRSPVEDALRKLPDGGKKPVGRRGQLRRAERNHRQDGEARVRGTRGTAVTNELRRRSERAKLRENLRRDGEGDGARG